jgi:hypothetical protein
MRPKLLLAVVIVLAGACLAFAAQERRSVVLQIQLPNGAAPQLRILEGATGTVSLPNLGRFGFVPALKDGTVAVELFDLNATPHRRLGQVDATVGGEQVETATKPQFGIRVIKVVTQ